MLSGGLRPENVAEAITAVRPFAVDTASGTEARPGVKDPEKVAAFIEAVNATRVEVASEQYEAARSSTATALTAASTSPRR